MKTSRRKFFGLMAAAPMAGKAAAEEVIAKQTGINIGSLGAGYPPTAGIESGGPTPAQYKSALNNPVTRKLYESLVYEQERRVFSLDPDIAVHRSTSLAAKLVYQRQRNVARQIEQVQNEWPWSKMTKLIKDSLGVFQ